MKFLLKTFILIVSLVCVILLIALFLPKDYHVERSVHINRSQSELYNYLRYLKSQEDFSPWQELDPKMKREMEGYDGEVGAITKWDSKNENVGKGQMEITALQPDKKIEYMLRFFEPWEMEASSYFEIAPDSKDVGAQVTWGFDGQTPWPWNISLLFMDMDEELGKDLDKGLKKLKKQQQDEEF